MTDFDSFRQAQELCQIDEWSAALKVYEKILKKDPTDAYLWYTIGHLHEILENYKESAVCFDKALSLGYGVDIEHVLEQKM
jgi:tetratricopeptide (TPR) repeat protein